MIADRFPILTRLFPHRAKRTGTTSARALRDHVRILLEELGGSRPNEILLRNERAAQQRRAILREEHPTGAPTDA